jgi:hypothetical protein
MRTLPTEMIRVLCCPDSRYCSQNAFGNTPECYWRGLFRSTRQKGRRSRLTGDGSLESERTFHRYPIGFSAAPPGRAEARCVLLRLLVEAFVPIGPLVVGIGETL